MDAKTMLRELILDLLTLEIKKEFSNIFSNNWPNGAFKDASNSAQATSPATPAKEIADMVADLRPLFYSPKEQRLLDYLTEHGPSVQTAIIAYFKGHTNSINDTTVKELLSNLKHRRALKSGGAGYERTER